MGPDGNHGMFPANYVEIINGWIILTINENPNDKWFYIHIHINRFILFEGKTVRMLKEKKVWFKFLVCKRGFFFSVYLYFWNETRLVWRMKKKLMKLYNLLVIRLMTYVELWHITLIFYFVREKYISSASDGLKISMTG